MSGRRAPRPGWPNPTYKTVAIALQNRRLLTISKKGGLWRADLLDSGLPRPRHLPTRASATEETFPSHAPTHRKRRTKSSR